LKSIIKDRHKGWKNGFLFLPEILLFCQIKFYYLIDLQYFVNKKIIYWYFFDNKDKRRESEGGAILEIRKNRIFLHSLLGP